MGKRNKKVTAPGGGGAEIFAAARQSRRRSREVGTTGSKCEKEEPGESSWMHTCTPPHSI